MIDFEKYEEEVAHINQDGMRNSAILRSTTLINLTEFGHTRNIQIGLGVETNQNNMLLPTAHIAGYITDPDMAIIEITDTDTDEFKQYQRIGLMVIPDEPHQVKTMHMRRIAGKGVFGFYDARKLIGTSRNLQIKNRDDLLMTDLRYVTASIGQVALFDFTRPADNAL